MNEPSKQGVKRQRSTQTAALRCAVYTRKSHEEGLDQSFNSLDAQSEACRAYILSQAGLGWRLRDVRYDDAGISGGHMDRPGLQALLGDIEAGLIDVVVVYKVDRLTRSLSDFSRLVEAFDAHEVSFVSVTQTFNTTTSMGRLTLNVLLSFAQFEREVTAERIRDKIAASEAKGMWMGGLVPLGYRAENRQLIVEEYEVETVRLIFSLYRTLGNVRQVKQELDARHIVTKRRITKTGNATGGKPFSRGHIHRILVNPIYNGKIAHKGKIHEGLHEPIVERDLWDSVQATLKGNASKRSMNRNSKSPSFLAGMLEDKDGGVLVAHHTKTRGKRYRYYVSRDLKAGDASTGWRVPAKRLESIILSSLHEYLETDSKVVELFNLGGEDIELVRNSLGSAKKLSEEIKRAVSSADTQLLKALISQVVISRDRLVLYLDRGVLAEHGVLLGTAELLSVQVMGPRIEASMTIRRRGQEIRLAIGANIQPASTPDAALVRLVARAALLRDNLETKACASIGDFAKTHRMHHADAKKLVPLGYLSPSIVEDILAGRQPADLTARKLHRTTGLPLCWQQQRTHLGFQ